MNCGSNTEQNNSALGLQVGQQTALDRVAPARFFAASVCPIQARQHGGAQALNADPQQVRSADQAHHIEGPGRSLEQRRQPQRRQGHMTTAGNAQAYRRGQRRAFALTSTGLQQQNHVRAGQQIHNRQRHEKQPESCHVAPHSLSIW